MVNVSNSLDNYSQHDNLLVNLYFEMDCRLIVRVENLTCDLWSQSIGTLHLKYLK